MMTAPERAMAVWLAILGAGILCIVVPWDSIVAWTELHKDASGWVQAVGSLLAVGVVLFVWRLEAGATKQSAIQAMEAFAMGLMGSFGRAQYAIEVQNNEILREALEMTKEALLVGRGVQLHQLPRRMVQPIVSMRALAVATVSEHDLFLREIGPSRAEIKRRLEQRRTQVITGLKDCGILAP
jgi:hypothetical protein